MELLGSTQDSVYVWGHSNITSKETEHQSNQKMDRAFTCPQNSSPSLRAASRHRRCGPPSGPNISPCTVSVPPDHKPIEAALPPNRGNNAQVPCFSQRQQGNNIFFPYRTQIVGSKLLCLPEAADNNDQTQAYKAQEYSVFPQAVRAGAGTSSLPTLRRDPDLPMTPEIGSAARLQNFVRSYGDTAGCYQPPNYSSCPLQQQHRNDQAKQQHHRVDQAKQAYSQNAYNSPSSHFPTDMRFMENAMRTYRRNKHLQMDNGQNSDGGSFVHEGDTDWHRVMMLDGPARQCPEAGSTQDSWQCARIPDGMGGVCYIYPNKPTSDPLGGKPKDGPKCGGGSKKASSGQKVIDSELESTLTQIKTLTVARDALYERLFTSDKSVHELKERLYSLPSVDRVAATEDICKMDDLQKCQNNLLNEIRNYDRELQSLWKHQYTLENKLTNQIREDCSASDVTI